MIISIMHFYFNNRKGSTFYQTRNSKAVKSLPPTSSDTIGTVTSKKGGKKYDVENDAKAKRIQQMHQTKVEQMEQEKLRRAQAMELVGKTVSKSRLTNFLCFTAEGETREAGNGETERRGLVG